MKKKIWILSALLAMLIVCFSMTVFAEDNESVTVTVNSAEGYSESGGNFVESNLTGFDGGKSKYAGAITAAADFHPDVPEAGSYRVSIYNISNSNAASQAEVVVKHSTGEHTVQYNQTSTPTGWMDVGVFEFNKGTEGCVTIRNSKAETLRLYGIKLERVETDNTEIFQDISELTDKNEIELLAELGILADVSGKSFRPYDNITRGEWAMWTVKIAGMAEKTDGGELFYDVPQTHPAFGAIAALYEAGVVSGIGNDSFRPDRPITELEGLSILLKVMGYGTVADMSPYPNGYIEYANRLKLGSGSALPLSREKAADIFYKALECCVYEIQSVGSGMEYGQSDETMLERYFELEPVEGIVTDNGLSSLYGKSEIGKIQIKIDDFVYGYDDKNKFDYLGQRVRAYVSSEDDRELKYIFPYKKVSSVSIPVDEIEKINGKFIEYYVTDSSRKRVKFSDNAVIIYNGMAADSFDLNELLRDEADNGTINAIDNDDDGVYDVLNITVYKTYVVHRINKSTEQIYVKDGNSNNTVINADPDDLLYVALKEKGIKLNSVENLKEWDVISAAQSMDADGVVVIYRSADTINGKITSLNDEYISIDGSEMKRCFDLYDNTGGIAPGKEYSFGLDKDGRIAWVRDPQNAVNDFGYLIKYYHDKNEEKDILRILGQNNEIQTYEAAGKWTVNDKKVPNGSIAVELGDEENTRQQLIRFSLDNDGRISRIETAKDNLSGNTAGSFTLDFRNNKGDEGYVRTGNYKTIAARYIIPSGMTLFVVPQRGMTTTDMNRYYVTNDKTLIANTDYDFDGYNINENEEITVGVVYLTANAGLWARSPMMVIDRVTTAVNEESGEEVYAISGYVNNEHKTIMTETLDTMGTYRTPTGEPVHPGSLNRGDIIQYSLGKSDALCDKAFKLLFAMGKSESDENMVSSKDTVRAKSIYGDMYYAYGWVVKTQANGFVFNTDAGHERIITLTADTPVLLVESEKNTYVSVSSVDEINAEDRVFVTAVNTNTQMVVIYR